MANQRAGNHDGKTHRLNNNILHLCLYFLERKTEVIFYALFEVS